MRTLRIMTKMITQNIIIKESSSPQLWRKFLENNIFSLLSVREILLQIIFKLCMSLATNERSVFNLNPHLLLKLTTGWTPHVATSFLLINNLAMYQTFIPSHKRFMRYSYVFRFTKLAEKFDDTLKIPLIRWF